MDEKKANMVSLVKDVLSAADRCLEMGYVGANPAAHSDSVQAYLDHQELELRVFTAFTAAFLTLAMIVRIISSCPNWRRDCGPPLFLRLLSVGANIMIVLSCYRLFPKFVLINKGIQNGCLRTP